MFMVKEKIEDNKFLTKGINMFENVSTGIITANYVPSYNLSSGYITSTGLDSSKPYREVNNKTETLNKYYNYLVNVVGMNNLDAQDNMWITNYLEFIKAKMEAEKKFSNACEIPQKVQIIRKSCKDNLKKYKDSIGEDSNFYENKLSLPEFSQNTLRYEVHYPKRNTQYCLKNLYQRSMYELGNSTYNKIRRMESYD